MERVRPANVGKRPTQELLSSITLKDLRKGIAQSNARVAVRGMLDEVRAAIGKTVPQTSGERMRLMMTTAMTESATRRPSPFNGPKHVYAGTVSAKTKHRRRAANRRARVARRANR